ncbi:hypothetical protein CVT26_015513 [Gymnopilus dilepis]|uniref:Uncharacterized protein n=1 Tax=Gymnopilus dilepis TaxID=231916 RepID=A0A409WA61_9AGAR|nr:hypothetical protein CVT26_015513 [Gymnopilus dilepis]
MRLRALFWHIVHNLPSQARHSSERILVDLPIANAVAVAPLFFHFSPALGASSMVFCLLNTPIDISNDKQYIDNVVRVGNWNEDGLRIWFSECKFFCEFDE